MLFCVLIDFVFANSRRSKASGNQKNDVTVSVVRFCLLYENFVCNVVCSFLGCFLEFLKRLLVGKGGSVKPCLWGQKLRIFS